MIDPNGLNEEKFCVELEVATLIVPPIDVNVCYSKHSRHNR